MRRHAIVRAALLTAALLLTSGVLAGCQDDDKGATMDSDTTALSANAPDGPRLCGFVPRASVEHILGDGLEAQGDVDRDSNNEVGGALCLVTPRGQDTAGVRVHVGFNLGYGRKDFDKGLRDDRFHQLPASDGLGYSYTAEGAGHARLGHGNYLLEIDVRKVEGRDAEKDAAALAQQVLATLQLPRDWTIRTAPAPSR